MQAVIVVPRKAMNEGYGTDFKRRPEYLEAVRAFPRLSLTPLISAEWWYCADVSLT